MGNNINDDHPCVNLSEPSPIVLLARWFPAPLYLYATNLECSLLSCLSLQIQKAFPTEAVKHIQEKPGTHAKHESHAYTKHEEQRFINQPRK